MKAPISKNIKKILDDNLYDDWVFRSVTLPERLRVMGFDIEVKLNGTKLKYFLNDRDVTELLNHALTEFMDEKRDALQENDSPMYAPPEGMLING